MFRHQGKRRSAKHNLHIAIVLSAVAGIVNVTGFLFIGRLTTNVTGHFALFIYDVSVAEFWKGLIYFLYIFAFLAGSFTSGLLIEMANHLRTHNKYLAPTLLECAMLVLAIVLNSSETPPPADVTACVLLFAMGLQNSFVTKISNAVVRTTHLTGLFTDLGIELSQLTYARRNHYQQQKPKIKASVRLRLAIITSFFAGGLVAGLCYIKFGWGLQTLFIPVGILLAGLFYDDFRFIYLRKKRHYDHRHRKHRRHLRRQSHHRRQ